MRVVACQAPVGQIEPAPLTSLPLTEIVGNQSIASFWGTDDAYYVRTEPNETGEQQWFRLEADEIGSDSSMEERLMIGQLMADITPIGGGRVAFPVGTTGRRFYRVWRANPTAGIGRTRIREVRAGRSRRLPA